MWLRLQRMVTQNNLSAGDSLDMLADIDIEEQLEGN